jgi:hypothetical protein
LPAGVLNEVGKLSIADRTITVKAAEALRTAVSLREAVSTAKRVDMRSVVFSDQEYIDVSNAAAGRIGREFERLAGPPHG